MSIRAFQKLWNKPNKDCTLLEMAVIYFSGNHQGDANEAADELAYLQACAAAVEDLSRMDATDATIAMFFKRDAKKLAKMKAKVTK